MVNLPTIPPTHNKNLVPTNTGQVVPGVTPTEQRRTGKAALPASKRVNRPSKTEKAPTDQDRPPSDSSGHLIDRKV